MTPRFLFGVAALCVATNAFATLVPLSAITVDGDYCTTCRFDASPELSIDGDERTRWTGTNDIALGDVNVLAYRFEQPTFLTSLDLLMLNRLEQWVLGELDVQVSADTSNGFDGAWRTVASRPGNWPNHVVTIEFTPIETSWLRLRMEYQGRGASGFTPAFGLHEIRFHRAASSVPEPSTFVLLAGGILGVAVRARRKGTR